MGRGWSEAPIITCSSMYVRTYPIQATAAIHLFSVGAHPELAGKDGMQACSSVRTGKHCAGAICLQISFNICVTDPTDKLECLLHLYACFIYRSNDKRCDQAPSMNNSPPPPPTETTARFPGLGADKKQTKLHFINLSARKVEANAKD